MKKRLIGLLTILTLLVPCLPAYAAGTVTDVSTEAELRAVNSNLSGSYRLTQDIALTAPWSPIGTSAAPFTGTLDGNGHTVSGLQNEKAGDYTGLFGCLSGAAVTDLTVTGTLDSFRAVNGFSLVSYAYVGAIAGQARRSVLTRCVNRCTVRGNEYVGGLTGCALDCTFTDCRNEGTVFGDTSVGGLTGLFAGETMTGCVNTGSVRGKSEVGGLIGLLSPFYLRSENYGLSSAVARCCSTGTVTASRQRAGGLIGLANAAYSGLLSDVTVTDCYNRSDVSGSSDYAAAGGLIGEASKETGAAFTVQKCYSIGKVTNGRALFGGSFSGATACYSLTADPAGTVLTSEKMKQAASFAGYDFSDTWIISGAYPYPSLRGVSVPYDGSAVKLSVVTRPTIMQYLYQAEKTVNSTGLKLLCRYPDGREVTVTSGFTLGPCDFHLGQNRVTVSYGGGQTYFDITVYNSYSERDSVPAGFLPLYTAQNVKDIALDKSGKYFLMNDITGITESIGSMDEPFTGLLLGNSYALTLDIVNGQGLFAMLEDAEVRDLTLKGTVTGTGRVGALAGYAHNARLSRCQSAADVTLTGADSAPAAAGGLIGLLENSSTDPLLFDACRSTGTVTMTAACDSAVGGLIGLATVRANSALTMNGCFSTGAITDHAAGLTYIGGLIGCLSAPENASSSSVRRCYNAGMLSSDGAGPVYAGGLIGDFFVPSTVFNPSSKLALTDVFNAASLSVSASSGAAGGLLGTGLYKKVTITRAYQVGSLSNVACQKGAVVSPAGFAGVMTDAAYAPCDAENTGATALSWADAAAAASYPAYDFSDVWTITAPYPYPSLKDAPLSSELLTDVSAMTVSLSGTGSIGSALTVSVPFGADVAWYRDSEPLSASGPSYVITAEDAGHSLYAVLTAHGLYYGSVTTAAVTARTLLGDLDLDGAVTPGDWYLYRNWLIGGGTVTPDQADMNGDGVLDIKDSLLLRRACF